MNLPRVVLGCRKAFLDSTCCFPLKGIAEYETTPDMRALCCRYLDGISPGLLLATFKEFTAFKQKKTAHINNSICSMNQLLRTHSVSEIFCGACPSTSNLLVGLFYYSSHLMQVKIMTKDSIISLLDVI